MPHMVGPAVGKQQMGTQSCTWSASKMHISSLLGTVQPGGYSWAAQLFRLPDLPFISPTGRLRPDTYCTSGPRLSTLAATNNVHIARSFSPPSFPESAAICPLKGKHKQELALPRSRQTPLAFHAADNASWPRWSEPPHCLERGTRAVAGVVTWVGRSGTRTSPLLLLGVPAIVAQVDGLAAARVQLSRQGARHGGLQDLQRLLVTGDQHPHMVGLPQLALQRLIPGLVRQRGLQGCPQVRPP